MLKPAKPLALVLCAALIQGCARQFVVNSVGFKPGATEQTPWTVAINDQAFKEREYQKKKDFLTMSSLVDPYYGGFGPGLFKELRALYEKRFAKVVLARSAEEAAMAGADIYVDTAFAVTHGMLRRGGPNRGDSILTLWTKLIDPDSKRVILEQRYDSENLSESAAWRGLTILPMVATVCLLAKPLGAIEAGGYAKRFAAAARKHLRRLETDFLAQPAIAKYPQYRERVLTAAASRRPAAAPASAALPAPVLGLSPSYRSQERPQDFALVIGVEKYSEVPPAAHAGNDAKAVAEHLLALGVPQRNLIHLSGIKATRTGLKKYLESWLPLNVKRDSRVYFYFSGHGAPNPETGDAYLLPFDGDPSFLDDTAYPLKQLYAKLGELKAKETVVALDACFSGAGGRSVLAKNARPLVTKVDAASDAGRGITVLAAASGDEITSAVDAQGHGTFTYFLLQGLNGAAADAAGAVTAKSLYDYLKPKVQDEARRQNRRQTPDYRGASDIVLRSR